MFKKQEIGMWIKSGREELKWGNIGLKNMEELSLNGTCFHYQQAAEKFLKAYCVFFDLEIIKTHKINYLIELLSDFDEKILVYLEKGVSLNVFAVDSRYPGYGEELTISDSHSARDIAVEIEKYVVGETEDFLED